MVGVNSGFTNMKTASRSRMFLILMALELAACIPCAGQQVKLVERLPDPHGSPRPARDARDVPVKTSIYFELEGQKAAMGGEVRPDSVSVSLQPEGGASAELLRAGGGFAEGCRGWLRPNQDLQGKKALAVYVELASPLKPATTYKVVVAARPIGERAQAEEAGAWSFRTGAAGEFTRSVLCWT